MSIIISFPKLTSALHICDHFNFLAAVTICSDSGAQQNKVCHCLHCFPIYCHEVMGPDVIILFFECWVLSQLFTLLFHFHQEALSSFSLSSLRVVSSAYLRLLIFLLAILIPACASSRPAFLMMYSAYKLKKQADNIQPWCTLFPIWNQSVVPCPVLTVSSWPVYRLLRRRITWSGIPISWRIFHSLLFQWSNRCWQFVLWFLCLF